jgi:flagellar basal-body rod protein FlgC
MQQERGADFSELPKRLFLCSNYRTTMSAALAIAASGMAAASLRLDVSAGNVANMSATGPMPDANASNTTGFPAAYVPLRIDQVDVAGGTAARMTTVSPSYVPRYDPSAPYADKNGMVAAPNVDLANEVVQQITALYTFAANAEVMQAESQMMKALLDIKAWKERLQPLILMRGREPLLQPPSGGLAIRHFVSEMQLPRNIDSGAFPQNSCKVFPDGHARRRAHGRVAWHVPGRRAAMFGFRGTAVLSITERIAYW